ncbi:hypothetical protein MJO29_012613 [Puccinia striiformis f. sp. tritici]|uniref:Uncharacterized protein n=2 Tax=Puccinia striiformis TaxID=27350 RepID=A0A2S4VL69_9BASI|nr:hypothetical protein MJO29_012613 [Puccinia striiformis f. sp. tritici]POW10296.1 hypothetical protein PSTT_06144 [Puccinia striiformis]POW20988.1 hypothetical protein PSHT_02926 [Puccinia striiformis]
MDQEVIQKCIRYYSDASLDSLPLMRRYLKSGNYAGLGKQAELLGKYAVVLGLLEVNRLTQSLRTLCELNTAPDGQNVIEETVSSLEEATNRAEFWLLINREIRINL